MFLFGKKRMVAEIEGGAAGASGPGAAPAAAPASAPPSGVTSPAAPAGGRSTPFPHILGGAQPAPRGAAPAGGADEDELEAAVRADPEGRGIPHDRVRQMRTSWEQRTEERVRQQMMRELTPLVQELQQLRGLRESMDPAAIKTGIAKSLLQALGVEEEKPQPKYLTEEEFNARIRQDREEWNREAQHRDDLRTASSELADRKTKYAEEFKHFPMLEELAAAVWSTKAAIENRIGIGQIIDGLVTGLKGGIGKYNEAYIAQKRADQGEAPITPGTTPTPGKKPEKVDNSPDAVAQRSREARRNLGIIPG